MDYASVTFISNILNLKYSKLNISNMDHTTVKDEITRLTDDLSTWSSTLCIPVNDSDTLLDISSAANGADSSVPLTGFDPSWITFLRYSNVSKIH